jgi:hypothetical protein
MKIGYIVNSIHPLLQTILPENIEVYKGKKPLLIVGVELAYKLFPNLKFDDKTIDKTNRIYYCFSKEEAIDKYEENITNFINHCFNLILYSYKIINLNNFDKFKDISERIFIYETDNILTITSNNTIYYINKEIYNFINNTHLNLTKIEIALLRFNPKVQIIAWNGFNYFGAFLKTFKSYQNLCSLKILYKQFTDFDIYCGALCLNWLKELEETYKLNYKELALWQRAYYIEQLLSQGKVRINEKILKNYASNEANTLMQTIYSHVINGYVKQNYNGTNKITGRMYIVDSDFSLQTLPPKFKDIIIAEKDCILVEIDYNYFEYNILAQLVKIKIESDPHIHLSKIIFGNDKHRDIAKTINYGLLFGQSLKNILKSIYEKNKDVIINEEELVYKLKDILEPMNGLKKKLEKELKETGYIINYYGRTIIPEKEWAVLNNYIQSTAADFVIIKLERLFQLLEQYNIDNKIVLTNHDSILFNLNLNDINNTDILEEIDRILCENEDGLIATYKINYGKDWKNLKN